MCLLFMACSQLFVPFKEIMPDNVLLFRNHAFPSIFDIERNMYTSFDFQYVTFLITLFNEKFKNISKLAIFALFD